MESPQPSMLDGVKRLAGFGTAFGGSSGLVLLGLIAGTSSVYSFQDVAGAALSGALAAAASMALSAFAWTPLERKPVPSGVAMVSGAFGLTCGGFFSLWAIRALLDSGTAAGGPAARGILPLVAIASSAGALVTRITIAACYTRRASWVMLGMLAVLAAACAFSFEPTMFFTLSGAVAGLVAARLLPRMMAWGQQ